MKKLPVFDPDQWRVRDDGEPYRHLHVYITNKENGRLDSIEMCDPTITDVSLTMTSCDLIGHLDVFRDGSVIVTINYEATDHALADFRTEYRSLIPLSERDDGQFVFDNALARTHFLLFCGASLRAK